MGGHGVGHLTVISSIDLLELTGGDQGLEFVSSKALQIQIGDIQTRRGVSALHFFLCVFRRLLDFLVQYNLLVLELICGEFRKDPARYQE